MLTHVYSKLNSIRAVRDTKIIRPDTPIAQSSLFTGAKSEPSMLLELQKEIVTADRIDWLVSFIKFSGLRLLLEQLQQFTSGGESCGSSRLHIWRQPTSRRLPSSANYRTPKSRFRMIPKSPDCTPKRTFSTAIPDLPPPMWDLRTCPTRPDQWHGWNLKVTDVNN